MSDPLLQSRRQFLQTLALTAPFPLLASASRAEDAGRAAVPPGDALTTAAPWAVVGEADARLVRKSEASMVTLSDGTVFLAYAAHAGSSDNAPALIVSRLLSPEGVPISEERVLVPPPAGGLNSMSPALQRLPDGRIGMLFSFRQSVREASRRFMASGDEGLTWTTPVVVADGQYKTGCHDRFTIHSSGRFLAPCHCSNDWTKHYLHVRVAWSDDLGATWKLGGAIELPSVRWPADSGRTGGLESGCIEPGIAERRDGSLLMTIRTAMGTQFRSESTDRGETWSSPRSMEVVSPLAPAHLSRVPGTDDLLLMWTSDFDVRASMMGERHTLTACISRDGGRSWPLQRRKVLVHDAVGSVDYPALLYRKSEAWIALRVSTGRGVLQGRTSTFLMRVPISWFYAA